MPKVLIGDTLAPAAVEIFKQRGIETEIKVGLNTEELIAEIPNYDGLVVVAPGLALTISTSRRRPPKVLLL